jgi:hypothetical protein
MAIFKFSQKNQITWNWKSSKKYIPTQHLLFCKKIHFSLRLSRISINFCQCMEVDYIVKDYLKFINFLKSLLHCVGPYIFCKVSLHTNVTQLSTHWNIPSLRIITLQVDWLHILLVLCLLELCVFHGICLSLHKIETYVILKHFQDHKTLFFWFLKNFLCVLFAQEQSSHFFHMLSKLFMLFVL